MPADGPGTPRVLVLGAQGLLGWHVAAALAVRATVLVPPPRRSVDAAYATTRAAVVGGPLDADDPRVGAALAATLREARPDVVVNAIAVTPASPGAADLDRMHRVNATFPHALAARCAEAGSRVVHVSTDAVFRGDRDAYDEHAAPDPDDAYGESKLRGELADAHCLTLRTSFFGASPNGRGLWSWLLGRPRGSALPGYTGYVFTPLSAAVLAETIAALAADARGLHGVVHAGGEPTSKFALLRAAAAWSGHDVDVRPVPGHAVRRVLAGGRLWAALGRDRPSLAECLERQHDAPFRAAYPRAGAAVA